MITEYKHYTGFILCNHCITHTLLLLRLSIKKRPTASCNLRMFWRGCWQKSALSKLNLHLFEPLSCWTKAPLEYYTFSEYYLNFQRPCHLSRWSHMSHWSTSLQNVWMLKTDLFILNLGAPQHLIPTSWALLLSLQTF